MNCLNRNHFCYVCGLLTTKNTGRTITKAVIEGFEKYFIMPFLPNLWHAPEMVCDYCRRSLIAIKNNDKRHKFKYVMPTIWLPLIDHSADSCYLCLSYGRARGFRYDTREQIDYANVETVIPAKLRSERYPSAASELQEEDRQLVFVDDFDTNIATPLHAATSSGSGGSDLSSTLQTEASASEYLPPALKRSVSSVKKIHFITQADFNDLVRDSQMPQKNAELWASRLQEWNLVADDFKVTAGRKRALVEDFDSCFSMHEYEQDQITYQIAYCKDIRKLFQNFDHLYDANEWRLFIDASKESLKGVLLHIGNIHPSIPIIYGRNTKETHDKMDKILKLIKYEEHEWRVCCDLKIVAMLRGIKQGFSKHQCFLCDWEGRKTALHYTNHRWNQRDEHRLGHLSVERDALVPSSKIILPPLHIKLGLMRNFVRALDKESRQYAYIKTIFPSLTDAKIEGGTQFVLWKKMPKIYIYLKIVFYLSNFRCVQWS